MFNDDFKFNHCNDCCACFCMLVLLFSPSAPTHPMLFIMGINILASVAVDLAAFALSSSCCALDILTMPLRNVVRFDIIVLASRIAFVGCGRTCCLCLFLLILPLLPYPNNDGGLDLSLNLSLY